MVQQAADDKNVKNIFQFNTPKDPYSSLIGTKLDDKAKADAVSPVHYVSQDNPPFLILHGTHDTLVPYAQSEEFAAVLKEKGVAVWLQKLPGSGHGGPAFGKPAVTELKLNFFDKYLKGADVQITLVPEVPARTFTADGVAVRLKSTGVIVSDNTDVWLIVPSRPLMVIA